MHNADSMEAAGRLRERATEGSLQQNSSLHTNLQNK
jgi:hypothetical protein